MKIAIATDLYYPMINGVAVFAHNLALGMAARGHEVLVLAPSMTGEHHQTIEGNIRTVYVESSRLPFYPDMVSDDPEQQELFGKKLPLYKNGLWFAPRPYREVKNALHEFQPDIIHNQTAEMMAMAVQKYAKKYQIPLVSTGHAYPDNLTGQSKALKPIKKPLDAMLRTWMASFLEHSEYATVPTEIALHGLVPDKQRMKFKVPVEPLSNGVDLSNFQPGKVSAKIAKKYHLPLKNPTVLYVGRVDPEKSIEKIIQAFAQAVQEMPEARMVIVGDGTSRPELEKLTQKLQITDQVIFTGKILPPDLYQVYRAGWLFATASKTETQGIVLIEAAATGLPLVAVDAGAVRELCQNDKNGVLCPPDDVDTLARGMLKVLQNDKLRRKYSAASVKIAAKHDINHTLKRFEQIYRAAIRIKKQQI